jgi:hypothetical protein
MSNHVNSKLLKEFYQHMKDNSTSENYQKGNLKAMVLTNEVITLIVGQRENKTGVQDGYQNRPKFHTMRVH